MLFAEFYLPVYLVWIKFTASCFDTLVKFNCYEHKVRDMVINSGC